MYTVYYIPYTIYPLHRTSTRTNCSFSVRRQLRPFCRLRWRTSCSWFVSWTYRCRRADEPSVSGVRSKGSRWRRLDFRSSRIRSVRRVRRASMHRVSRASRRHGATTRRRTRTTIGKLEIAGPTKSARRFRAGRRRTIRVAVRTRTQAVPQFFGHFGDLWAQNLWHIRRTSAGHCRVLCGVYAGRSWLPLRTFTSKTTGIRFTRRYAYRML